MMRTIGAVGALVSALGCGGNSHPEPVAGHPRLLLNDKNLAELRGWATPANPIYTEGLKKVTAEFKQMMDSGKLPASDGDCADETGIIICEQAMEVLAFMAVVSPDQAERDDCAARARSLLMNVISKAKEGPLDGDPIRDPSFPIRDRAHNGGEGFGLTVDWIYPYLSASDKADIREVFLMWAEKMIHADTTTMNHPEPVGVFNDPVLLADPAAVRFAGNNYFVNHAFNLGLMVMSIDPEDDADGKLRAYLDNVTGAFLYMTDALLRGDSRGGLLPEGDEYSPLTMGNLGMLMLALHTAGLDDVDKRGAQVSMTDHPFWQAVPDAYLQSLAPAATNIDYPGPYYSTPSFGDLEVFEPYGGAQQDPIRAFASIALIAKDRGDTETYDKLRWMQENLPPGGVAQLKERINSTYATLWPILYFLLMDPGASPGSDPRPDLPKDTFNEGLNFTFSRTGWGEKESFFSHQLTWVGIDHRHSDDNHFSLFRKGEWITKETSGYADVFFTAPLHNNVSVQNDPLSSSDQLNQSLWETGSVPLYSTSGDGKVLARSFNEAYAYVLGDATDLHNSASLKSTDVAHLSRSIVWLKPDHVITYDRVETKKAGGFKRVYLQLPSAPAVSGAVARAATKGGQAIVYTSILPGDAALSADPLPSTHVALGEPMSSRLRVEAPGGPASTRFLGVLQAGDAGAAADPVTAVTASGFAGVVVSGTAVLFPVEVGGSFGGVSFDVPDTTKRFVITGLAPNGTYDVTTSAGAGTTKVTIAAGSDQTADEGGVLSF